MTTTIHALHGFLGKPSDWDQHQFDYPVVAHPLSCNATMSEWAQHFNDAVSKESGKRVLLGYSLGGRLALHALLQQPNLWDAAILISTHTGLSTPEEILARHSADSKWAKRFEGETWSTLTRDWNAQVIFARDPGIPRFERDYCRQDLAKILRQWSLAQQDNLLPKLAELQVPTLFVAGQQDPKFTHIAKACGLTHPKSKIWIAPEAGHRVPWQQPALFEREVRNFFRSINL